MELIDQYRAELMSGQALPADIKEKLSMTAAERRIIITHAIVDKHKELWSANEGLSFRAAFVKTGSWLDVRHLLHEQHDDAGAVKQNGTDDPAVHLQGLSSTHVCCTLHPAPAPHSQCCACVHVCVCMCGSFSRWHCAPACAWQLQSQGQKAEAHVQLQ